MLYKLGGSTYMNEDYINERWNEFVGLLRKTNRDGIESLISWLDTKSDFKYAPASTRYHLNCKGGLLVHSLNVYYTLIDDFKPFIDIFKIPEDTLIISALLHDICKANTYTTEMRNVKRNNTWVQEPYYATDDVFPLGHGEKSVIILQNHIKLNSLEVLMIRWHMGYSDRPQYDGPISDAYTKFPQILVLNWADCASTFMIEGNSEGIEKFNYAGFDNLFEGRSVTDSLNIMNKPKEIVVDGTTYELAPPDAVVDGNEIIIVNAYNGQPVKVYAPYEDGLPF